MGSTFIYTLGAPSYFAFIGLVVLAAFIVRKKRREGRFPLGEDVLVVRRAGEHLSQELAKLEENLPLQFVVVAILPMFAIALPIWIVGLVSPVRHLGVLVACVALTAASLIGGVAWLLRVVDRFRDTKLGLFGERFVADCLEPLKLQGYDVFHDVPCLGATGRFNLDHVVVGGGSVTVVETKTRRKRREGKTAHKVTYDGSSLIWPDKRTTRELDQTVGNAAWLQKELKKKLDLDLKVHPALTMPGWFVNAGPPGQTVLVVNPKMLPSFITQRLRGSLTVEQMDLICRHLKSLTANVDFAGV